MASSSSICASCLRALRTSRIASKPTPPNLLRTTSRAYRTTAPSPQQQSIYLDFLAPSALRRTSKPARLLSPSPLPARTYATATTTQPQSTPDAPPPTPTSLTRAILHPRTDSSGTPMLISLTPRASHRLSSIMASDANPSLALRVSIESGGCHGFQYLMNLVDLSKAPAEEEDTVFEGAKGAKVVIDESSLELLKGSTVDYSMELIGSQFKVTGIPGATSSCGCGTSFDIQF